MLTKQIIFIFLLLDAVCTLKIHRFDKTEVLTSESDALDFFVSLEQALSKNQFSGSLTLDHVMENEQMRMTSDKKPDGLMLEFGVFKGESINRIAQFFPTSTVYGFDSFQGLPEKWVIDADEDVGYDAGVFSAKSSRCGTTDEMWSDLCTHSGLPEVRHNVELHRGWFNETLPTFTAGLAKDARIALLHLDADLYSSTKTILTKLQTFIFPGTILVFDEIVGYPDWRRGEAQAFYEFLQDNPQFRAETLGKAKSPDETCDKKHPPSNILRSCVQFCDCVNTYQSAAFRIVEA